MKKLLIILTLLLLTCINYANAQSEEILVNPEIAPEFPNGENGLIKFLADNFNYPLSSDVILTKFYFGLTIDTFGLASFDTLYTAMDSKYKNSVEIELLRTVELMPKWKPAELNGKKIESKMNIPLRIEIK